MAKKVRTRCALIGKPNLMTAAWQTVTSAIALIRVATDKVGRLGAIIVRHVGLTQAVGVAQCSKTHGYGGANHAIGARVSECGRSVHDAGNVALDDARSERVARGGWIARRHQIADTLQVQGQGPWISTSIQEVLPLDEDAAAGGDKRERKYAGNDRRAFGDLSKRNKPLGKGTDALRPAICDDPDEPVANAFSVVVIFPGFLPMTDMFPLDAEVDDASARPALACIC